MNSLLLKAVLIFSNDHEQLLADIFLQHKEIFLSQPIIFSSLHSHIGAPKYIVST